MSEEIWKELIKDYYKVSTYGRVCSLDRLQPDRYGGHYFKEGRELSLTTDGNGYKCVKILTPEYRRTEKVHRLVAIAFIENPEDKPQVNHKDGDKSNNVVDNLEWATNGENQTHAFLHKLNHGGVLHPHNVLKLESGVDIKYLLSEGFADVDISKALNVHRSTIRDIRIGKSWKTI